jgi:hypothetical protein
MKVSEIIGSRDEIRGKIEFDAAERDRYVARFLAAFNADVDEDEMARLAYEVHLDICFQYDLYIAVCDVLGPRLRRALHFYMSNVWKFY